MVGGCVNANRRAHSGLQLWRSGGPSAAVPHALFVINSKLEGSVPLLYDGPTIH